MSAPAPKPRPKPAGRRFPVRRVVRWLVAAALVALVLAGAGRWLVHTSPPRHPDAVFVLSGFKQGERARAGAELLDRTGARRLVLFVGGETDVNRKAAAELLREAGVPARAVRFLGPVSSSEDEARLGAGLIKRCRYRSVAVVTSPYHTRRAGFLWRRAAQGRAGIAMVSDRERYDAGLWFTHLEDLKVTATEWVKLVWESRFAVLKLEPERSKVPC